MDLLPLWVSLHLGLWVTGILAVVTLPLAWGLHRSRGAWKLWVEPLVTLPLVVSPTVFGYYFLVLFSPQAGLGAWLEQTFGLRLVFSFPGLVAACSLSSLPFMYNALKAGLQAVPVQLLEASATLGKTPRQTFFGVVLPLLVPALATGALTTFAHTLGEFGVVLMVGGSLPGVTKTASIALFERVENLDFVGAQAWAVLLAVFGYAVLVVTGYWQRAQAGRP